MNFWRLQDFKMRVVIVACAFFYVALFVELLERRIASAIEERLAWRFNNLERGTHYIAERVSDAPPPQSGRRKASS